MRLRQRRVAASAVLAVVATLLSGCFALPVDETFKTAIPEALEGADLGLSDAYAARKLDGLTASLYVSASTDDDAVDATELTEIVSLVVANTSFRPDFLELTMTGPSGQIALRPVMEEMGADTIGAYDQSAVVRWDDATAIAKTER